ncbi:MAG: tetratricopeptide repeat protein [Ignavibacteria bacterium]|nr:MAG: tetratricopeptide repeat protein [Ignavibacteria bacterium]
MLRPKKKITKREIKEDELLMAYARVSAFYYGHKKYVSYAITGLIAVIIGIVIIINNRRANNDKAAVELAKVVTLYEAAANNPKAYQQAIDGQPERGVMGLKTIVDNYGSTESGQLARFYLANAYFNLGRYEEALKNYENFSGGNKLLEASALAGMGACLEAKGEFDKAASSYEKAAGTVSNTINTPEYLNSAARCYGRAGAKEKAIALLKRLKQDYPTSTYAREVDRYISEFST